MRRSNGGSNLFPPSKKETAARHSKSPMETGDEGSNVVDLSRYRSSRHAEDIVLFDGGVYGPPYGQPGGPTTDDAA